MNILSGLALCFGSVYLLTKFIKNIHKINIEIMGGGVIILILLSVFIFGLIVIFNNLK